jgi:hypothetical protein
MDSRQIPSVHLANFLTQTLSSPSRQTCVWAITTQTAVARACALLVSRYVRRLAPKPTPAACGRAADVNGGWWVVGAADGGGAAGARDKRKPWGTGADNMARLPSPLLLRTDVASVCR